MFGSHQYIFDRYRVIDKPKQGGFSTVFFAWDTLIQRKVAIKRIDIEAISVSQNKTSKEDTATPLNEDTDEAFAAYSVDEKFIPALQEVRNAALLNNPYIVSIYDFHIQNGAAYIIMEFVDGMSLTEFLNRWDHQLTLNIIAAVFNGVSKALIAAHKKGVLHLDIKPDNVLIDTQGNIKVGDFGLSKLADSSGFGSAAGGTIGYMPPEQIQLDDLDERCDEWALASLTYQMLSGNNPFITDKLDSAKDAIIDAELILPSLCWDNLSPSADDAVFYALNPDRNLRYDSVSDFSEELLPFLGNSKEGKKELVDLITFQETAEDIEKENNIHIQEPSGGFARMVHDYRNIKNSPPVYSRYSTNKEKKTGFSLLASHRKQMLSSALQFFIVKILGILCCFFTSLFACYNNPYLYSFSLPLPIVISIGIAILSCWKLSLASVFSLFCLACTIACIYRPVVGIAFMALVLLSWVIAIKKDELSGVFTSFLIPLAGFGFSSFVPLIAGLWFKPLKSLLLTLFSCIVLFTVATITSSSLFSWNLFDNFFFFLHQHSIETLSLSAVFSSTSAWYYCVIFAGWLFCSALISLVKDYNKLVAALAVSFLIQISCLLIASYIQSGAISAVPEITEFLYLLVSFILFIIFYEVFPSPMQTKRKKKQ